MKKLINTAIATALSASMILSSGMVAFATDANGATGTGSSTGHLDTDIVNCVLPTESSVASIFDFVIDPERLIDKAGTLADGTTAVTKNDDGVYFVTGKDATNKPTFGSSSQPVPIKVKNYVAADVKVVASVADGNKIALAAAADELDDAEDATLFLELKVGDETGAITNNSDPVTKEVAAQPDNFQVVGKGSKYELEEKQEKDDQHTDGVEWTVVNIQLSGKINNKPVEDDNAPEVELTWTIAKHVDYVAPTKTAITDFAWSSQNQYFYFAIPEVDNIDLSKVTSVVATQDSVSNTVSAPTKSSSGKYIIVTWDQIKADMTWPSATNNATIEFDITYDGAIYNATYQVN